MPTVPANEDSRRELASTVKRLRVAVTSDPSRTAELADAMVALNATRLQAWAFSEAAADAPDAVVQAARILAQGGASGPYTSLPDGVRFFTASAQLAAVQGFLGLAEAAARTLDGLDAWRNQLGRLPLVDHLSAAAVVWSLLARARAYVDDPALANAYADAASAWRFVTPMPAAQTIAVHLTAADCRWAGGHPDQALAQHRLALTAHESLLAELPARPRPALVATAAATAAATYEPYASRLESAGQVDFALGVRRAHLALLDRLGAEHAEGQRWLAAALRRAGRAAEADEFASADEVATAPPTPGRPVTWTRLDASAALSNRDLTSGYAASERAAQESTQTAATARRDAEAAETRHRDQAAERARQLAEDELAAATAAARAAQQEAAARQERERTEAAAAAERRAKAERAARQAAEQHRQQAELQARLAARAAAEVQDELTLARSAAHAAAESPADRAHNLDRLAGLLRPLTALEAYRDELATTLEALVGLRWQLGEADASREAARELKALTGSR